VHDASRVEIDKVASFRVTDISYCGSQSEDLTDRSGHSQDGAIRTTLFPASPLVVRETAIVGK